MHPIQLRGARTNNLRGVDLEIAPGTFVVVCGPSGAGKSSLAFGTLYAEGQRRYVESFSAYARQFLERLARPPLDSLQSMPPAIAVDRGGQVKTSRSTVATLTELSDCLKQLWALAAELRCPHCGGRAVAHSPQTAADALQSKLPDRAVTVAYPLAVASEEDFLSVRETLLGAGYRRLLIGDDVRDLDGIRPSEALGKPVGRKPKVSQGQAPRPLYVVADRTSTRGTDRARLVEALEVAFERGGGQTRVVAKEGERVDLSRELCCESCGSRLRRASAGLFSFNSPIGACEQCRGFGRTIGVDWDKVLADRSKSIEQGAIKPWAGKAAKYERRLLSRHCKRAGIAMDVPLRELTESQIASLIEGDGGNWRTGYPGLRRWFTWLETRAYKMHVRVLLARYRSYDPCEACGATRFKPEVRSYR
ncbi:MAG: excinuclease ABC subunit A, partial [Polyangiales bacterium]